MKVSLIIPTYNEAKTIPILIPKVCRYLKKYQYEIIVVDDNSPDRTWEVAKRLPKKYKVKVIRRMKDKGLSQAVIAGFGVAKGDIIGVIDADLSHPPEKIPKLIEQLTKHGADMTIGSRLIEGGRVEDWPAIRKFISFGARLLARPLTPVKDIMSGFFFIKREVISNVDLHPRGYKIGLEIIIKGNIKKITEIPIIFRNREVGESKLDMKTNFLYLLHVIDLYMYKFLGV